MGPPLMNVGHTERCMCYLFDSPCLWTAHLSGAAAWRLPSQHVRLKPSGRRTTAAAVDKLEAKPAQVSMCAEGMRGCTNVAC